MNFLKQLAQVSTATCLAVMAIAVFLNVVLRYGFDSGIAASEELSRLLFVWMVFIGAAAAYPTGEHMAFTSLVEKLQHRPKALYVATTVIRLLVILAASLLAWGAWQQVRIGLDTRSVVMGYPIALLPLPALLCALVMGICASIELIQSKPLTVAQGEIE